MRRVNRANVREAMRLVAVIGDDDDLWRPYHLTNPDIGITSVLVSDATRRAEAWDWLRWRCVYPAKFCKVC